jgi:hypothetical protein
MNVTPLQASSKGEFRGLWKEDEFLKITWELKVAQHGRTQLRNLLSSQDAPSHFPI